ncbi:aminodeoxychorismate synthase component I [Massilia norwichensis]|uniref:Aminodeoxychorismate synthase component I n=1 Tax=Massilia norwichensis TaxID=1442366 RepID=A0ABT2AE31_9BURK|nr:aminodeoxychorismate synthase component I [Massilia norwichensis]MCS0592302.1 aminodeoxychorismate synthase component I [Massilia norwichensis]
MNDSAIFALLDDASPDANPSARSRLYRDYAGMLACHTVAEWPALLARLQEALAAGLYAVPVLGYELGEQLLGIVPPRVNDTPLAQVLLFRGYDSLSGEEVAAWLAQRAAASGPAGVADVRSNVDEAAFTRAIGRIRDYIAAGDTYQVNYTYRLRFDAFGDAAALYARLRARQPVPYGALIQLPDGRTVLSLSPELFVRHDAGRLLARPMKGTAPASGDEKQDAVRSTALAADPKNRAENLMIVDLLRNDLGRIARTGSVGVPALFEVRRYSSVLQMTSTVQAQLADGSSLDDIFGALYPCGSITGAPKRRTMEIIHELEPAPRGIYTGALGWIDPPASMAREGSGFGDFCLSVPIRTLVLQPPHNGVRHGELGVGAGIVYDSDPAAEYAECQLKASFLTGMPNDFEIFETIHATREDGCRHLERHLARLQASAAYFGYPFTEELARAGAIAACAVLPAATPHRLRLALQPDGDIVVHTAPLAPLDGPVEVLLSEQPVDSSALFARHKTSIRSRYDAAWKQAESVGAFDTLFFNECGDLAEGGRSSVFVRVGGRWYTPPLSSGVLPGVMRALLLEDPAWNAIECPISRETLERAQEIVVCNALRGPLRATIRRT